MEKKFWYESLQNLKRLLDIKKEEKEKLLRDIEEIEYSIDCYEKKADGFVPEVQEVSSVD